MSPFRYRLLGLPLLVFLTAATPSEEAASGLAGAGLERNRQLLDKWKANPEHHARLRRDLHDFWALPQSRRQQICRLDREFHRLDERTQKRLWKTAERYNAWLERLPEDQRRQIEETKDPPERLRLIRAIRERQWIERLPRKVREDLEKLTAEAYSARVSQLREQERQQRQQWKRPFGAGQRPK